MNPSWAACGSIMGMLSKCYRSKMRLFKDRPDVLVEGRWYWSPEGAKKVPFPHAFYPSVFDEDTVDYDGVGEVREVHPRVIKGVIIPGLTGQKVCGKEEDWQKGTLFADRGKLPLDTEGRCKCCMPPEPAGGGDGDAGQALQRKGWGVTGQGGDGCDGSGLQVAGGFQVGNGGCEDDGQAVQWAAGVQVGDGGDEDDGSSEWSGNTPQEAEGGEGDDGSAGWSGDTPQLAEGGDGDDGSAAMATDTPQLATGGDGSDGDDGQAEWTGDTPQLAAGGDGDDGEAAWTGNTPQLAAGGDGDDGDATEATNIPQGAEGGDGDDGSATQTTNIPQGAAGGDGDDGEATQVNDVALTGSIILYGSTSVPGGYLACDGSAVSRSTYSDLFAVIGTSYGVGNGSTTFNLPDLRGRVPLGAGTGSGLTARSLGGTGGEENHQLPVMKLPPPAPWVCEANSLAVNW